MSNQKTKKTMEELISFAKSRGFVYPSSEIYGGMSAIYDYGPYGVLLKNNLQSAWWQAMVQKRDDIFGLDSQIFMHPKTWEASGHVASFDDPQIDCRQCQARWRADHLLEKFDINADKQSIDWINEKVSTLMAAGKLKCPSCGSDDLTPARRFSLMVKSNIGAPTDELSEENVTYLRPETCGGIYLNYKNIMDSLHPSLPFGVAQVGKAFRNEIVARQWIFRTREFEQMEMQYFLAPEMMTEKYEQWRAVRSAWYLEYGMDESRIRWYKHTKLAHYASAAYDIEYQFQFMGDDFKEIEGIHARGNWDLSQHSKFSGAELSYFDSNTGEKFTPHIMETSVGLNRLVFMFLDFAYHREDLGEGKERLVLKLDKRLAPIKVAILPLLKNKPELVDLAHKITSDLRMSSHWQIEYDQTGTIGKRYRRQDEIGTPYCVTVDFESLEKGEVTVRDRDTMKQEKVKTEELGSYLKEKLGC